MAEDPEVQRLVAPLRDMYRAGRYEIPHEAERMSRVGTALGDLVEAFTTQSGLAGNPAVLTSLIEVCTDVHTEIRGAVPSLNNAAVAVTATADDFVEADEYARAAAALLTDRVREGRIPSYARPPTVGDPPSAGDGPPPPSSNPRGGDAGTV